MKPAVTIYKIEDYEWHVRQDYPRLRLLAETFTSEAEAVAYCKARQWFIETVSR